MSNAKRFAALEGQEGSGRHLFEGTAACQHAVQFYENDTFLADTVADYVGAGLEAGEPIVVIATEPHRDAVCRVLRSSGFDVDHARKTDQLTLLDARAMLAQLLVNDMPDAERFSAVIGKIMAQARAKRPHGRARAYGEMVNILWGDGNAQAALRLEELWNELQVEEPFSLLCTYAMDHFASHSHANGFEHVCARHSRVLPTERYAKLEGEDSRLREIGLLQQRARALESEIEHRKELERQLREANRLKDEFLATVSHELRTPLNAILGWARMLRAGRVPAEKMPRALDTIERNTLAQVQLVEDLLDVSRIVSGKMLLDVHPVELSLVIESAIDSLRPALEAKGIALQVAADPGAGPVVGDAHRLQQVVWNLVCNAMKFTPKGGRIRIAAERVESRVEISVSDTGQGIAKPFLRAIFERFKQADASTTREHGGLGLGLAISRHIVELHGGAIEARSEGHGRGATFIVTLPVHEARETSSAPFAAHAPRVTEERKSGYERPAELQGLTILLVDTDQDSRDVLSEVLTQCGCTVLTASSSEEALAILDRASPNIMVCDVGMPGAFGHALMQTIRRRSPAKGGRIPAAVLTAYASAEDRRRALRAGYQMHIAKPVEPAELLAALANLAQISIAIS
jgi:signal transduction histidine kinase/ActR/RegA family two-component response regulator